MFLQKRKFVMLCLYIYNKLAWVVSLCYYGDIPVPNHVFSIGLNKLQIRTKANHLQLVTAL